MAYIIGLLSPEEEKELERRGWELEDCPEALLPRNSDGSLMETPGKRMRMVWVDNDMYRVMSGPDWDLGEPECEVCDECDSYYPPDADSIIGPWHQPTCSAYAERSPTYRPAEEVKRDVDPTS